MDEIQDIVNSIVKGCSHGGMQVSDVLAAFIAKTILQTDTTTFALDKSTDVDSRNQIVMKSIEKLLERDNPSLETIKMQVDFDASFLKENTASTAAIRARNKVVATHKKTIAEFQLEDGADFESLTTIYRMIFRYLIEFPPESSSADKLVEREVAAALESVFPRIGLKTFIQLTFEEKSVQLLELGRIILGIRLFNKDQSKGGAGIHAMEEEAFEKASTLAGDLENEISIFSDACDRYQAAIVRVHQSRRKMDLEREESEKAEAEMRKKMSEAELKEIDDVKGPAAGKEISYPGIASDQVVDRWSQELVNRRQYLNFLRGLMEEAAVFKTKLTQLYEGIKNELQNISVLVSERTSVPKEVVYPRFDALGSLWIQIWEESTMMKSRLNTMQALSKYRLSFTPTLSEEAYVVTVLSSSGDTKAEGEEDVKVPRGSGDTESKVDTRMSLIESIKAERAAEAALKEDNTIKEKSSSSGATLLSIDDTPDFMLLPLELQGYCPWTMVYGKGLLVPGKPSLGVVRYNNAYYVCDHNVALTAFLKDPEKYLTDIKERAKANPEFIHLLRVQNWFPAASIARLLNNADFDRSAGGKNLTQDASTETPLHFQEKFIDVNYHWNEWELRKRALKVSNLKKCLTTSQQTDDSHFRRDNDSQVYPPKQKGVQTKREKGTNPPTKTSYVAGLRGAVSDSNPTKGRVVTDRKSVV